MNEQTTITLLVFALVLVLVALGYCLYRMDEMNQEVIGAEHTDHAKCVALMVAYVGDEFAAQVLRAAAHDYDSVEGQARAHLLGARWVRDGHQSIPALWLEDRADTILRYEDEADAQYNLAGERVL